MKPVSANLGIIARVISTFATKAGDPGVPADR